MDPDSEAEQAASNFPKSFFMLVVLFACYKLDKSPIVYAAHFPYSVQKEAPPPVVPPPVKKKKKTIYLTFDDGPNKGTRKLLHIIQEELVPVSMFIVGEHVYDSKTQQDTWDSLLNCKLVELCNHSFTHARNHYQRFYQQPDSVVKDFDRCRDSLHLQNNIGRTPGRNIWRTDSLDITDVNKSSAAADSLEESGFSLMGWDVEWRYDAKDLRVKNCADQLLEEIDSAFAKGRTRTPEHLVLLAHDQVYADFADSAELHLFIKMLKEKTDYQLEVVSNYPGLGNKK